MYTIAIDARFLSNDPSHFPLVMIIVSLLLSPVLAWGPKGHELVSRVACNELNSAGRSWVRSVLGNTDFCEEMVRVSTWADEQPDTAPFHFVNSKNGCGAFVEALNCGESDSLDRQCLVTGIPRYVMMAVAPSSSPEDRNVGLKMLIHLMADLHQPMHLGFAEDRGGNDINLNNPTDTNLHEVWDSLLIKSTDVSHLRNRKASALGREAAALDIENSGVIYAYIADVVSSVSSQYTCPIAYKDKLTLIRNGHSLSKSYLSDNPKKAATLLYEAGTRLGGLLNNIGSVWKKRGDMLKPAYVAASVVAPVAAPRPLSVLENDDEDFVFSDITQVMESVPVEFPRFEVDGVDISRIVLFRHTVDHRTIVNYVTTRGVYDGRVRTNVLVTIRLKKGAGGEERLLTLAFDTNVFPPTIARNRALLTAVLHKLRTTVGIDLKTRKSSTGFEFEVVHKEGSIENIKSELPENTVVVTSRNDRLVVNADGMYIPSPETEEHYKRRYSRMISLMKAGNPIVPIESDADAIDQFALKIIASKCQSIVEVQDADKLVSLFVLDTTVTAADSVDGKPLNVLAFNRIKNGVVRLVIVDSALLETDLTPAIHEAIFACKHNSRKMFDSSLRPSLYRELEDVHRLLRGLEIPRPVIDVNSFISFKHPSCGNHDGYGLEWRLKSI